MCGLARPVSCGCGLSTSARFTKQGFYERIYNNLCCFAGCCPCVGLALLLAVANRTPAEPVFLFTGKAFIKGKMCYFAGSIRIALSTAVAVCRPPVPLTFKAEAANASRVTPPSLAGDTGCFCLRHELANTYRLQVLLH
jgi:hypothetical protein